ncbi:MAG TPA: hypothetical protein VGN98_17215 [Tianweitania sediminis]|jgi:hypothetical protein|nr:hypothetical protein [Tianweitania sediminis]
MTEHDFPIPYPGTVPGDDLASARLMIKTAMFQMEDSDALASDQVQCLFGVLCAAFDKLEVIQLYMDDHDAPDMAEQYRTARRLWTLSKGGAK